MRLSLYLRSPDARIVGVGTENGTKAGLLGRAAAGPVLLHVGTTFVEPTVAGYEPTEGATTDPYPAVPGVCANESVLVRVNAVANAMVVSFMSLPFVTPSHNRRVPLAVPLNFLKRD